MERLSDYTSQLETREFAHTLLAIAHAQAAPGTGGPAAHARARVDAGLWAPSVAKTVDDFLRQKAAVPGLELGTGPSALTSVARQTYSQTVLGRLEGAQRLPFANSALAGRILGVGAAWRKEGAAIPVSRVSFDGLALSPYSVGALVVATMEFVDFATSDRSAADTLARLLQDAVRAAHDAVFAGSGAAVPGISPPGIAENAVTVASTGATAAAISADVNSMVAAMVDGIGTVRNATWILSAEAFSLLAALKVLDSNVTTLAGLPIVTNAPSGSFLLVDSASLYYAVGDGFVELSSSTSAMIEMATDPTGHTLVPTAASKQFISLFQEHAISFKASLASSWALDTAHGDTSGNPAVIQLTGATYA